MSSIPEELKYTKSHEWVRIEDDGSVTVGITEHAQELLGDMVFVELPEVGSVFEAEEDCAVVESVKAASDVYSPISGEIIAVNEELEEAPELVNNNAFHDGWLFRLNPTAIEDIEKLMDAEAYGELIAEE